MEDNNGKKSTADIIYKVIRDSFDPPNRTDLNNLFGRHKSSSEIRQALDFLEKSGLIRRIYNKTNGRPEEVWKLTAK